MTRDETPTNVTDCHGGAVTISGYSSSDSVIAIQNLEKQKRYYCSRSPILSVVYLFLGGHCTVMGYYNTVYVSYDGVVTIMINTVIGREATYNI